MYENCAKMNSHLSRIHEVTTKQKVVLTVAKFLTQPNTIVALTTALTTMSLRYVKESTLTIVQT